MKRKMGKLMILSLTAAITLSSVPYTAMAAPAETGQVQTQSEGDAAEEAQKLVEALGGSEFAEATGSSVTLKKDFKIKKAINIPEGVTLNVPEGVKIELDTASEEETIKGILTNLFNSKGSIRIYKGGSFSTGTEYIGGEGSYYYIEQGSIKISNFSLESGTFLVTIEEGSVVECSKNTTLQPGKGINTFLSMLGIKDFSIGEGGGSLTIEKGATLNVTGGLRGISGGKFPSEIIVNGKLDCTDGLLSLAKSAKLKVGSTGEVVIGDKGLSSASLTEGFTEYNFTGVKNFTLSKGGKVVNRGSKNENLSNNLYDDSGNKLTSFTDADGNTAFAVKIGEGEGIIAYLNGSPCYGINDALNEAASGDTITLAADVTIDYNVTNPLKKGVTLVVPTEKKLTIDLSGVTNASNWKGIIKVEAGGTVEMPDSENKLCNWVGADENARLWIKTGYLTYDFGKKEMVITGNAKVPEGKTEYLHLMKEVPITGVIAEGANLTVEGTFKVVSDSTLNVKGTLDVKKSLVINGEVNVGETGTLNLPLMSKEEMDSTTPDKGLGMDGPINISGGATVSYSEIPVLNKENGYIILSENAKAVLSFANANGTEDAENPYIGITLESGEATVNGLNGVLKALLKAKDGNIPFSINVKNGAKATVPEGVTLALVNGSFLTVDDGGEFNVEGTLEERSEVTVQGKINLSGIAYIFRGKEKPGSGGTYIVKGNGVVYADESEGISVQNESGGTITLNKLSIPKVYDSVSEGISGTFNYSTKGEAVSVTTSDEKTTNYSTLKEALENAESGDTVTLLEDVTVSTAEESAAIGKGVTLVVPDGKTFKVELEAAESFLSSEGKVQVNKGGVVVLPTAEEGMEPWIGKDETARVNLTEGSVIYDFRTKTVTLTENSKANIPEGKTYYLHLTENMPISSVIENGAEFTVNGIFKAVRDSNIKIEDGGIFTVAEGGIYEDRTEKTTGKVNVAGTAYIFDKEGLGNFVITGSGIVYAVGDISDNVSSGTEGYEVISEEAEVTYPGDSDYSTKFTNKYTIGEAKEKTVEVTVVDEEGSPVTAPVAGQKLKAVVKVDDTVTTEGVTYKWYYEGDDETVLSAEAEYTVASDGAGETLCVDITYNGETKTTTVGEITSEEQEAETYKVTVKAENGTVTADEFDPESDGTYTVEEGKDFVFTVTPEEGFEVTSVEANGEILTAGDNGLYTVTVTGNTTITVKFTEVAEPVTKHTITATAGEGGKINPSGSVEVEDGERVTFTITAYEGYEIDDVIVDGTSKGAVSEYTFENVKTDAEIKASFAKIEEEPKPEEPEEPEEPDDEKKALTIQLSSDKATIFKGEEIKLEGFITNYKDFTEGFGYRSENEDIATVTEDGVVTGVKQGNTSIIITAKESDTYYATTTEAAISFTIKAKSSSGSSSSHGGGGGSSQSYDGKIEKEDTDNGSFSVNSSRADKGDEITITVKPDEGYIVDKVIVKDEDGNIIEVKEGSSADKYIFEMPDGDVSVEVTFIEETENEEPEKEPEEETSESEAEEIPVQMNFSDVNAGDWFYNAVEYVYGNGLMSGTSQTAFSPNANTTRGMIAAILYRLEGSPSVSRAAGFADVPQNEYYSNAVAWGAANGIISGYDSSTFAPDDNITREQMAAILYRYAQYKGMDTSSKGDLSIYTDKEDISEYALEAMSWAVGEGLISGMGDGSLAPQGYATRAQIASILMRFAE